MTQVTDRASDAITVTGLRAFGRHGVLDFEKEQGQDFVVDVRLELDLAPAGTSDDLSRTVHYGLLSEAVHARIGGEPFDVRTAGGEGDRELT